MTFMQTPLRIAVLATLALAGLGAMAADDDPAPAPQGDKLAAARALIADRKWAPAIEALKKVNDTRSADWNNLMGYSHRKAGAPNYAAAERYYTEALRIDGKHRGALEYSGELYLMMGDLAKAEARLATLSSVCGTSCEEYKDLKGEVDRFKAAGKKYTPR